MASNTCRDAEADRFLREGLTHYLPAVRALSNYIQQIESRIRDLLKPYDNDLNALGLASSTSKLSFSPKLCGEQSKQIDVGIRIPQRSGFYIFIDMDEAPSRSLYVGHWLWTPLSDDRQELFKALNPVWGKDGFETEQDNEQTLYVGSYLNREEHFPAFEPSLEKVVQHVISGLTSIRFSERFGARYRKERLESGRGKGVHVTE